MPEESAGLAEHGSQTACVYCASSGIGRILPAREMMFGLGGEFEYAQCARCDSLRLATPLSSFDLSAYYPANYYSLSFNLAPPPRIKSFVYHRLSHHLGGRPNLVGALIQRFRPGNKLSTVMATYGVAREAAVLDVGCGNGKFLALLREGGFRRLRGCDPYVARSIAARDIEISKCELEAVEGLFDVIFFHHSLEHVADPGRTLAAARDRQRLGGKCIVRIPTTSSLAFETYGSNWVQLDAPRHLSIPSRDGMRSLAERYGYRVARMIDDSNHLQFWGSEQYVRGIAHRSEVSYGSNPRRSIFSRRQIADFKRRSRALNAIHRGDQTAFILEAV